jgi:hypothetical protein
VITNARIGLAFLDDPQFYAVDVRECKSSFASTCLCTTDHIRPDKTIGCLFYVVASK